MKQNRLYHKITIWLLLPLVLWVSVISISNFHYHKLPDGSIICHSHPYNNNTTNSPFSNHHHSTSIHLLLQQINIGPLIPLFGILILIPVLCFNRILSIRKTAVIFNFLIKSNSLRAPPVNF